MFNSINMNLSNENNAMNSLHFFWKAELKDGTIIHQFDKDGIEHRYQEVKDKFINLKYFYLYNKNDSNNVFIVDLINGFIYKNKIIKNFKEENKKYNIRLIYFRTHRKKINLNNLKKLEEEIHYNLGFQYLDSNNINHKIILQIDKNGDFLIGEQ